MMSHWMFNCKEVSRRVSESMDRRLPVHQRLLIRVHLLMCRYCARFRRQMMIIRELCRSPKLDEDLPDTPVYMPPDARRRIKQALKAAAGSV